jgi:hypothetical protein
MSLGPPNSEDGLEFRARRALDSVRGQFTDRLFARAHEYRAARKSGSLADSDIQDAYRDLTERREPSKGARCLGDGLAIGGAALFGLAQTIGTIHFWLGIGAALLGVGLCVAGLYVREFLVESQ